MQRKTRNIIFDLGGVILNIDYKLTEKAFTSLGLQNFKELYSRQQQVHLFDKFETGEILAPDFRDGIRNISEVELTDEQIDQAWNAMLIDLPASTVEFLHILKKRYRLFLLSNTNEIHISGFTNLITNQYGFVPFDEIFERIYYSNRAGLRKPDEKIFCLVLNENNLLAHETLFIDDTEGHLTGAAAAGMQTLYLKKGENISVVLRHLI